MNRPEENDPVEALLHEQNQYVEDGGFTARVISSLPRRHFRFRPVQTFLLGVSLIGWMLAMWWLPWGDLPPLNASVFLSPDFHLLLPWVQVLSVIGSLIWAIVTAVQWED